ncbi:DUF2157 domain-containing protein [Kangiella sp. TOML190]|uniref:DUF2157 domain-containing protein n=1 Tax=Kangiella sp. TOML190 TaxID=2931351 RepID=UPI00203A74EC|nr:DUF2157 domain-containing protein [Kangiella sp. TOML190]
MQNKSIGPEQQAWLLEQSKYWLEQNIINEQQAQTINGLYQKQLPEHKSSLASAILASIGALLIGGGVILLFAHNWEHLGKVARTLFSFLPLVLAQLLCFYVYRKKFTAVGWREAAATLVFFAVAASIALIGQTYHIYGDLERFVLSWLLLGLPLIYLMRSNMVLILSTVLIVWLCTFQGKPYWLFFLALMPYWLYSFRRERNASFYWSTWLAAFGFAMALIISAIWRQSLISLYPLIFLLLMSSVYYLAGKLIFGFDEHGFWKNPLVSLGAIGIGCFSLLLSNNTYGLGWYYRTRSISDGFNSYLDAALLFVALAFLIFAVVRYGKSLQLYQLLLAAIGLVGIIALFEFAQWLNWLPWLGVVMNLFILVAASLIIIRAVEQGRALLLNAGLLWLSGLILLRFFDSDLSIFSKGMAFIFIGSAFIGVNVWFNRQHNKQLSAEGAADE